MRAGEPSGGRRRRRSSRLAAGSSPVMMPWITVTGSRPSASGHLAHRGCPARSREETGRPSRTRRTARPRCPQGAQYQSWPRRRKVRSGLPHRAQHGGETDRAPAWRNARSRSPTARGAGDLPSASTAGRPARAAARRRDLARPPATAVTTARTCSGASPGPAAATSSVISPTGSLTARSQRPGPVTAVARRECGPAGDAGHPRWPRRRLPSSSGRPSAPAGADGSIRSSIEQSRMSSSAISTFRLSRSGPLDHQPVDLAG